MAPTAIYATPQPSLALQKAALTGTSAPPHKSLVIGSLSSARDGKYQALISELEGDATVERQMLDRLVDGGMFHSQRALANPIPDLHALLHHDKN
jgi:anamorsin